MTPPAAQLALNIPTAPPTARRPRKPGRRAHSAPQSARFTYTPPVLTVELATEQARRALTDAGLVAQVTRVVTRPTFDRSGWLTTVALLRAGADPVEVADALAGLPGAEVRCGEVSVSVYREVTS